MTTRGQSAAAKRPTNGYKSGPHNLLVPRTDKDLAQNVYDQPEFFDGYSRMDRSVRGLDGAPEWPAIQIRLLPELCKARRARLRARDFQIGKGLIQGGERRRFAMAVPLRADFDAVGVRCWARKSKDGPTGAAASGAGGDL